METRAHRVLLWLLCFPSGQGPVGSPLVTNLTCGWTHAASCPARAIILPPPQLLPLPFTIKQFPLFRVQQPLLLPESPATLVYFQAPSTWSQAQGHILFLLYVRL